MTRNIGKTDKMIRIVVGIVIAILGIAFKSWWGLLAILPLGTVAIGWCWLYPLLKISTVKKETDAKKT